MNIQGRLPELDQGELGRLPIIKEGMVIQLQNAPWSQAESQAASVLLQVSAERGQWQPLLATTSDFGLERWSCYVGAEHRFWDGLEGLLLQEEVEIILHNGSKYVLIHPSLVQKASYYSVVMSYQPAVTNQPTQLSDKGAYPFWS